MNAKHVMMVLGLVAVVAGCGDSDGDESTYEGFASGGSDSIGITCQEFKQFWMNCFSAFCAGEGASTPFCGCWQTGQDLSLQTCECIALNLKPACAQVPLEQVDPSKLECESGYNVLKSACVP